MLQIPCNNSTHHFYMFSFLDARKVHNRLQWIGKTRKMAGTSGNSFYGSYRVHRKQSKCDFLIGSAKYFSGNIHRDTVYRSNFDDSISFPPTDSNRVIATSAQFTPLFPNRLNPRPVSRTPVRHELSLFLEVSTQRDTVSQIADKPSNCKVCDIFISPIYITA